MKILEVCSTRCSYASSMITMNNLFRCFCILFCAAFTSIVHADICNQPGDVLAIPKIMLKLYNGTSSDYTSVDAFVGEPEKLARAIAPSKSTVVFIHGFIDNSHDDIIKVVFKAYLDRGDVNIIIVDWGNIADDINYIYVSQNVPAVGKAVAKVMNEFEKQGLISLDRFLVAGHSLGAHIAAHVARYMNGTVQRLIGLDPAFPLFYPSSCHIKAGDAKLVVALHTDGGIIGTPVSTADVDFYANKGVPVQPGCPRFGPGNICSHRIAVRYFASSVLHPKGFPARKCEKNTRVESDEGPVVHFTDLLPLNMRGEYCFSTNPEAPYGKDA